ncbi:DNA-methyltransferase [Cupriavidus alkaliphilus]|uniref:DNA-methyltransferase n=1 Tax=Cupriavidus alkaliphilus TaxID=942866 RepID=UPI00161A9368|nr:site-specific DNA-methyltransferase [Cupriavidus alkaliphilus]MBB2918309.1 site-specific DNA-methyltransferase (cytosine-N4-specific) [Cupriavidus alkaliphilus]
MRDLIAAGVRVQCIVTSPPYWGLRDYGVDGQLGLEPTLREFLANMVDVFDLCRQLLADDGTLWLNMGDSYTSGELVVDGLKPKDLVGQPWRLAFAMQGAGWRLRQDIIWHKPNPMPESITDRCTKAHEYLFLLTKGQRYYFDQAAIREPANVTGKGFANSFRGGAYVEGATFVNAEGGKRTVSGNIMPVPKGWDTSVGEGAHGTYHRDGSARGSKRNSFARETKYSAAEHGQKAQHRADRKDVDYSETRNKRSVWTVATQPYAGAHFATFPEALVEPCILAGSRPGDIVFDPFMGSGTVASVAQRLGRRWLGAELNADYITLQAARTRQAGLVLEAAT